MKNRPHDLQILFNSTENPQQNALLVKPTLNADVPPPFPKMKLLTGLPKQYLLCVNCSECWVGLIFLGFMHGGQTGNVR